MITYADYFSKYIRPTVILTEQRINGRTLAGEYLFRNMLRKTYSVTGKYESILSDYSRVSADYVALDSSLPMKSNGQISTLTGDIPKIGMEKWFNETQLKAIDIMISMGRPEAEIAAEITKHIPAVIDGVEELNERAFLQGYSEGKVVIPDNENVGIGLSLDFGYKAENKFGVAVEWTVANAATSKPLSDIRRVRNKARMDGNTVTYMYMDWTAFNGFAASEEVKQQFGFYNGFVGSNIPTPSVEQLNAAFAGDAANRLVIKLIDRQIVLEKDGKKEVINPWKQGIVILTNTEQVGSLVWTDLAEDRRRAPDVIYEKANDYTLVSVERLTRPSFSEHTKSQAMVIPVITNSNSIYQLDSQTVQI